MRTVLQGIEFSVGSEIEGMEAPSEEQRSEGDSILSIERMVMRERAVCKTARDRTPLQY